jgi:ketosteroid isomerase-like protein
MLGAALLLCVTACVNAERAPRSSALDAAAFEQLLETLARAWNAGDARAAADCFREDAVCTQPPGLQVYRGREALFAFFGGEAGRAGAMSMTWRRVAFDAARQRGFGEFSFRYGSQVHGVAVIDVRDGRIAQWREYWMESEAPFEEFVLPGAP